MAHGFRAKYALRVLISNAQPTSSNIVYRMDDCFNGPITIHCNPSAKHTKAEWIAEKKSQSYSNDKHDNNGNNHWKLGITCGTEYDRNEVAQWP